MRFRDRADAGRQLAAALHVDGDVVVLGLPRGGVPVAAEVAAAQGAPLDVLVVRKLGAPGRPELAIGALAAGVRVLNEALVARLRVPPQHLARVTADEQAELERRERAYRAGRPALDVADRTVVLVDDGLATGATVVAAVEAVRRRAPRRVVVAVPVGAPEACARVEQVADELVCPHRPREFRAVGAHYGDFGQTGDHEVQRLLAR